MLFKSFILELQRCYAYKRVLPEGLRVLMFSKHFLWRTKGLYVP